MLGDAFTGVLAEPEGFAMAERSGIAYSAARWTPASLSRLTARLARLGPAALEELPKERLVEVWEEAIASFLDPSSAPRRLLEPALVRLTGLTPEGLAAGLKVLLEGVRGESAWGLLEQLSRTADPLTPGPSPRGEGRKKPATVAISLAGNLPGLVVQGLLPALLVGRPVLVKSSSSEPLFAPRFAAELVALEPSLAEAIAVVTWRGGERSLEDAVFDGVCRVVAYGEDSTIEDLRSRLGSRLQALGPGLSLAALAADVDPAAVAPGLARDIALFDQRGCLSVHAIFTEGDPQVLADRLAAALAKIATELPAGPLDPLAAAAVQQLRLDADLRGLYRPELPLTQGTVIVESRPELETSPLLRTVRIHRAPQLSDLPRRLAPWRGRLQGLALSGGGARELEAPFRDLGCHRFAVPGQLQRTDYTWWNGGRPPLELFGGPA